MRITLIYEESSQRNVPFAAGVERFHRFADELGHYAGVKVPIIKDRLRNAPQDGYILFASSGDLPTSLSECGEKRAAQLTSRLMLLDVTWQHALDQLEKYKLAGAVDSLRMSEWLARPSSCKGPFGLRYLTPVLEASCVPLPALKSKRYCLLESKHHRSMPHLLADYLAAYDCDMKPLEALPSVALAHLESPVQEEFTDAAHEMSSEQVLAALSRVESASTQRTVAALKRVRERVGMTLAQLSERVGLDSEQLSRLESGNLVGTTLGTLRGYVLGLESASGWTLAETRSPTHLLDSRLAQRTRTTRIFHAPSHGAIGQLAVTPAPLHQPDIPVPLISSERGMTVMYLDESGDRRSLKRLTDWTRKEVDASI